MTTEGWRRTTLGQIAGNESLRTGPFGSQLHASDYRPQGVPVVMPRDFADGSIRTETIARVSPDKAEELAGFQVRTGDILLARRGEMGRCTRIDASQDGWLCGTGVLRIRPDKRVDSRFLTYLLRNPETVSWLRDFAVGQTLPSLNVRTAARLPLFLPPIREQRKIARILRTVERTIECSRAVITQCRRLRNKIWRRLLIEEPDCFGRSRTARDSASEIDSRGWRLRPIGSLCTIANGNAFKATDRSTSGLPIIRIQNLNGSRRFHHFAGDPASEWLVEPGELLFAWSGAKGSSFGPCLWPGPRGVLNQHIFRIRPTEEVAKEWLFETLRLITRAIEDKAQGFKNDLQHVRKKEVTEHLVPVPPYPVQRQIASLSRALATSERSELEALDTLIRLRDALARDLTSGHVRGLRH